MKKESPYALALKFNLEEIDMINEFSILFSGFLQLDSYVCYNFLHNMNSYTYSLELLFMLKFQLKSAYEDFYYIKVFIDDKIIVINEVEIFGEGYKDISLITDLSESKNCALPISMSFLHEGNSHKMFKKNKRNKSPIIYFQGMKTEMIFQDNYLGPERKGESGGMIEKYISTESNLVDDCLVLFMVNCLI